MHNKLVIMRCTIMKNSLLFPIVRQFQQYSPVLARVTCQCPSSIVNNRSISTSSSSMGGARMTAQRQAKMLKKIMSSGGVGKRKHFFYDHPVSHHLAQFGLTGDTEKARGIPRKVMKRMDVLDTIFIEHITSLLATGEVSPEFLGLGIQISKVQITPDFSAVNVFWYASGSEKDEKIEKLLESTAGHLRHVLSSLRVIGVVPPIFFFKDTTFSKLDEVHQLLDKCDLGEDFRPTPANVSLDSQHPTADAKEETETEDSGKVPEPQTEEKQETPMRQDILGVRHDFIMNKICASMKKRQDRKLAKDQKDAMMRSISDHDHPNLFEKMTPEEIAEFQAKRGESAESGSVEPENFKQRQREFLKYLKNYNAQRSKELRMNTVEAKEREFYTSEREERISSQLKNRLDELDEVEDDEDGNDGADNIDEEKHYENFRKDFN